jgi:hypothetical protein
MDLKINEIKIGNIILWDGVEYIVKPSFYDQYENGDTNIKPIPLSVEWLKKAGYKQLKRIEKTYSLSSFEDNSSIYFTGVRFIHIITGTQLDFVHELQNLHFCLQKQELKFI